MKTFKNLLALAAILVSSQAWAQTNSDYVNMEKRFVKKELTAQDTAAFRKSGEQRVRQLFDKGNFYIQNSSNTSNQAYVKNQIPDLFYVPEGDTLDLNGLLEDIEKMKRNHTEAIELSTKPADGFLGKVETLNCEPRFTFYLVLKQVPKKFGDKEEWVWQVFLHNPQVDGRLKKPMKGSKKKSK